MNEQALTDFLYKHCDLMPTTSREVARKIIGNPAMTGASIPPSRHFHRGLQNIPALIERLKEHAEKMPMSECRKDIYMACNWLDSMSGELARPTSPKGEGPSSS